MNGEATSAAYPGNLTLPAEVRQKILSTFRHTLDLYRDGKLDDCLIGCDFILKMDPRFVPARRLQEKARNPKADVDVEELESVLAPPVAAPTATPPAAAEPAAAPRATGSGSRDTNPVGLPEMAPAPDAEHAATGGNLEGLDDLSLDSLSLDAPLGDLSTNPAGGVALEADAPEPEFDSLAQSPFAESGFAPLQISPQEEIESLLKKGDEAHAAGDPQQAIEIWSRIFLHDINNYEAVARIEGVRGEMAEESRRSAPAADGLRPSAGAPFDPSILAAEANSPRLTPGAPLPGSFAPPPAGVTLTPHDLSGVATPADVLAEEMDQSGPPGGRRSWTSIPVPQRDSAPHVPGSAASAPAGLLGRVRGVSPRLAMIAGAALVVVAGAVFFLTRPSGGAAPVTAPESGPTLAHATRLFQEGKIEETTAELKRIPRGHPDYDRAQKLLASLPDPKERSVQPVPESAGAASAARDAGGADPAAVRADAERAFAEKRYIDAMKSFSLAAPHFQGDPTFAQAMGAASEKVSELTPAVKLYNDGEYETAIPILWRIYSASRDNVDARSYLMRSYYNQGVLQLQNGLYDKARESFGEVLSLDPQDTEAARHRQFAERYRNGDLDLMGRIYVRYISPRS